MKLCGCCSLGNADGSKFCIGCGQSFELHASHPAAFGDDVVSSPKVSEPVSGGSMQGAVVDGKYRIERLLGEGGMGVVYLARDVHTDTHVVVKSVRADHAHDPDFRERILAEGRVLARIDHPNVVRLNAIVIERGELYLVMQFIEGASLDVVIERHTRAAVPIPIEEALRIFRMVVEGVGAAHAEGIIHRDIKPANVLLRDKDGVAKVTDFGIAKQEDDAKAGRGRTQGIIGSLSYMAPEQILGLRDLDKRVDVYSLGILLFELLTGRLPFHASNDYELMRQQTEAPLPRLSALRPDAPAFIDELLSRACAKNRQHRFPSCEAMLAELDRQLAREPTEDEPRAASTRSSLRIATALVSVVGLGGLGAFLASSFFGDEVQPRSTRLSPTPPPSEPAKPPESEASVTEPLAKLAGAWRSDTGRLYDAVLTGDQLELRIRHASQFPRQGYLDGEARLTLTALPDSDRVFGVLDKIRPEPPLGYEYEPTRSRGTCQEIWTSIAGRPLRAQFDGTRLTVDMAKIEPRAAMFQLERGKVVGCVKLSEAKASLIESVYTRE